ncbi:hypothetical protein AX769_16330 [Frondihabitans sp. PAMC 28766]|uniref:TetR/AcrR family transcriptional regulator n=1 Tax=Frondihabitans sp. PAMC 28766 TaxID=1795630 RepID=UPI00078D17E5|nr:TetR family transcriptional regulator C-terminal domain-containing protein [Frondihabitans sp. PAMC 28766]AMM21409.1 hypothetical protein AX769_16330 [Frondihabitans sp. PAMC 28766]
MADVVTREKPRRRKSPVERRDEIVEAASRLAIGDGLGAVTAKRVAQDLGVVPGLVTHYFSSIDDLVAAAFVLAAARERDELYASARAAAPTSVAGQLGALLDSYVDPGRDTISLLWLDAWQDSRRRPALADAVEGQMLLDYDALAELIEEGIVSDGLLVPDPREAAVSVMALVDGLSIRAAVRDRIDYAPVVEVFTETASRLLGLAR